MGSRGIEGGLLGVRRATEGKEQKSKRAKTLSITRLAGPRWRAGVLVCCASSRLDGLSRNKNLVRTQNPGLLTDQAATDLSSNSDFKTEPAFLHSLGQKRTVEIEAL